MRDPRARVVWAVALALTALPLREAWREITKVRPAPQRIDVRLAALRDALPPGGDVGWIWDGRSAMVVHDRSTAHVRAQYAIAPRLLRDADPTDAALVAWSDDPTWADAEARRRAMTVVLHGPDGYAVLVKSPR